MNFTLTINIVMSLDSATRKLIESYLNRSQDIAALVALKTKLDALQPKETSSEPAQ